MVKDLICPNWMVVFAENMLSDIRIIQTALRPNRLDPNDDKKKSYIIIPYMESDDIMINNESFNRPRMVISKLRNNFESTENKIIILIIISFFIIKKIEYYFI